MKKFGFASGVMALAVLVISLSGCSKATTGNVPQGAKAYLTITIEGKKAASSEKAALSGMAMQESRAFDDPDEGRDQAARINDLTVFIMDAGLNIIGKNFIQNYSQYPSDGDGNYQILTNTNAKHIYIVGNTINDETLPGGVFGDVRNLDELQYAFMCYDQLMFPLQSVWIQGNTDQELDFSDRAPDGTPLARAENIRMNVIPARIDVTVNNNMANRDHPGALMLEGVALLYSGSYTRPVPQYNGYIPQMHEVPSPYYRSGIYYPEMDHGTTVHYPCEGLFAPIGWGEFNFEKSLYGLPAIGRNQILTVVGNHNGMPVYFPVHFETDDTAGLPFENGKLYQITINLNGDALLGGGGVPNPEIQVGRAYVTITVEPAKWEVMPLPVKEF